MTVVKMNKRALTAAQRPHLGVLRVHLRDVGDAAAQDVHGDVGAVLVAPVGRLVARAQHLRAAVRRHARHHAADVVGELEQVRDGRRVQQPVGHLALRRHHGRVRAAQRHRRQPALVYRLQGVF